MQKYQGNITIEQLEIGMECLFLLTNQRSVITNKTKNSVEILNFADKKYKDKNNKLLGINSKNWYTMEWFNRKFKLIEV